MNQCALCNLND
ncbi:BgTH12-05725 [Blumeria graminis f. sp. triticale]|uniref:BgTH12-05725 n=1 Tax=Blumeria graminis f. sp. triticale TaxID=1689686 RepID=A0A9W4DLH9_BLUGR|nr:BgTH12-05725 [Blumeria graminis f. sp. triticale]